MPSLHAIARVVIYDAQEKKILLVRNRGASFWNPPGGQWEFERESILECVKREVLEETGKDVAIGRLLYVQQFQESFLSDGSPDVVRIETFWLGTPRGGTGLDAQHKDLDPEGEVDEARWFGKEALADPALTVWPARLKDTFWENIEAWLEGKSGPVEEDPFIGIMP